MRNEAYKARRAAKKATKYQVWYCKIVVPLEANLPNDFDWPPRKAACEAIIDHGIDMVACFSGWGGDLTDGELNVIEKPN